jgi:type IV secretory pathway VirB2 component (pilin)
MINNIAIGLAMGLIVIGVIAIFISGIKNIINGNSDFKRVAVMVVPVIIFAACNND